MIVNEYYVVAETPSIECFVRQRSLFGCDLKLYTCWAVPERWFERCCWDDHSFRREDGHVIADVHRHRGLPTRTGIELERYATIPANQRV